MQRRLRRRCPEDSLRNTVPEAPMAKPCGEEKNAWLPIPLPLPEIELPASVVTAPSGVTMRRRWLK